MSLYEFMATCNVKHRDPVAAILKQEEGVEKSPMLVEVLRIGFAQAAKRPAYLKVLDEMMRKEDPQRFRKEQERDRELERELEKASAKAHRKFAEGVKAAVETLKKTLFDEWMVMGSPLGDATRETLLAAANKERELVGQASKRESFYVALIAVTKPGAVLKDSVSLSAVEEIHRKVFAESMGNQLAA